jgi:opacity protein-like surface antigen
MRKLIVMGVVLAGSLSVAPPARADVFLTPFLGAVFSGDAPSSRVTWGGALGGMAGGVFGVEAEFGRTPTFFESSTGDKASVTTVMFNLLVGVPAGGVAPYVTGGLGLIRQGAELTPSGLLNDITSNDFGYNFGGGLRLRFSPHVGVRGDLRYFKVSKTDGLSFWRAYAGVTLGG